jgi:hypothetical protein
MNELYIEVVTAVTMKRTAKGYEGRLINLWLYKENSKLRDEKNVFTLHIPP